MRDRVNGPVGSIREPTESHFSEGPGAGPGGQSRVDSESYSSLALKLCQQDKPHPELDILGEHATLDIALGFAPSGRGQVQPGQFTQPDHKRHGRKAKAEQTADEKRRTGPGAGIHCEENQPTLGRARHPMFL
jgi:hypothetical protein